MTTEFSRRYSCNRPEALNPFLKENNYICKYFEGNDYWILDSTGMRVGRIESNLPICNIIVFNGKEGKKLMRLIEHADL